LQGIPAISQARATILQDIQTISQAHASVLQGIQTISQAHATILQDIQTISQARVTIFQGRATILQACKILRPGCKMVWRDGKKDYIAHMHGSRVKITVGSQEGNCDFCHKAGDSWVYEGSLPDICPAAWDVIYPYL